MTAAASTAGGIPARMERLASPFRTRMAFPLEVRAAAMIMGGIVEIVLGVVAEGRSLVDIARPPCPVRAAADSESELTHRPRRPA
jgi:hypothetical protein